MMRSPNSSAIRVVALNLKTTAIMCRRKQLTISSTACYHYHALSRMPSADRISCPLLEVFLHIIIRIILPLVLYSILDKNPSCQKMNIIYKHCSIKISQAWKQLQRILHQYRTVEEDLDWIFGQ